MKKKLSLNDLKVKSFVTETGELKARGGLDRQIDIVTIGDTNQAESECGAICSCFGTCDAFCNEKPVF